MGEGPPTVAGETPSMVNTNNDNDEMATMADLSEQDLAPRRYQRGEIVEGEVVRVDDDGIVVSIGLKTEGIVPPQEMRSLDQDEREQIKVGNRVMVTVKGGRGPGDMALLSFDQAKEEQGWLELLQHSRDGSVVTARMVDQNRGGVVVNFQGIRGFVPFSQLAPVPSDSREQVIAERMGQEYPFHILEIDQARERLVLSERAIWQKKQEEERDLFIAELEEGTRVTGRVTSVRGFGAFVSLGKAEGLVHISELSWTRIKGPEEVVSVGQELDVQILKVDQETKRISLSHKRTLPEPWESVPERYNVGDIVDGTVTRLADFGAFVRLEDWVEGLVHISELSPRQVKNPSECVYVNQQVRVMILDIDPAKRRISLSYKKAFGM
ncbi:MAG: S1 RNA-binding domain-containing protein [Chloroflexi bacterium]|nr:S1 RNA-binding domain-containing protein [Chloroflexota bacterium]